MRYIDFKAILLKPIVPISLCVFFLLLTIWQLVNTLWFAPKSTPHAPVTQPSATEQMASQAGAQENTAASLLLFGEYLPENLHGQEVRQSMLDLKVVGVIFSENEQESKAIIAVREGKDKLFGVNSLLPGGAIIKRITPDGVLVSRNGVLESLSLPKDELVFEPPAKPLFGD